MPPRQAGKLVPSKSNRQERHSDSKTNRTRMAKMLMKILMTILMVKWDRLK